MHSAEFWLVQYCFVAKGMSCLISSMSVVHVVNARDGHNSNDSMSTKRKRSVLSIKDKEIIISCLDKGEKGTNLASANNRSDIRKNKDKILKFTDNIERSEGLKWKSLKLANDKQLDQALYTFVHMVYSAEVDWNTNFRPTSSEESETFLSWLVRQIQKSAWHKEPWHSRRESFSSRRNCWTLFRKTAKSDRGKTTDTGTNLPCGQNWTVVEMFTIKNSCLMSREIRSWIQKSQRSFNFARLHEHHRNS